MPCSRAVFCAKAVADQFSRGIFETYLQLSCVPFLSEPMTSSSISSITNQLTVADVMARGVTALPPVIAIPELLHILTTTSYSVSSFPFIDSQPGRARLQVPSLNAVYPSSDGLLLSSCS